MKLDGQKKGRKSTDITQSIQQQQTKKEKGKEIKIKKPTQNKK